ncbi:MAG: HlyD family secretion protein [bacterium]
MSLWQRISRIELGGRTDGSDRRAYWIAGGAAALLLLVLVPLVTLGGGTEAVLAVRAESREFVAAVVERGPLKAAVTTTYNAPRMRRGGGPQIVELVPEGAYVEPGDLVVRFDDSDLQERLRQEENQLARSQAEYDMTKARQESQMASLQAQLEQTEHSHEQARLNLQRMEFESEVRRRQEELSFEKSVLALERARENIENTKRQNEARLQQLQVRLERRRRDVEEIKQELEQTSLYATQPGLVTYEMTWGPSGRTKVKVGDSPWGGQAIVSIPDLSTMTVNAEISELDVRRVAAGQEVLIRVDAYPDTVYTGRITEVSPLARRVGSSQLKVFDGVVGIQGSDLRLRPGMTATVSIITDYARQAVVVPREAVFRRGDEALVYRLDGGIEEVPVELGPENGSHIVIRSGLESGALVALRDPHRPLESLETAGAEALTQQRQAGGSGGGDAMMTPGPGMRMRIFR